MLFAHGFGCDQSMLRFVAPAFEPDFRVILFDLMGCGRSDLDAYQADKYETLAGHTTDVLEICAALELTDVVFVGHSVSAMIGAMAAIREPERFAKLVMIGPSPRYVDDEGYDGGFSRVDIDGLLEALEDNHLGWSNTMAPVIMGNEDRPELATELAASFCRMHPTIALQFARATFLADHRADLPKVPTPTLVMQCSDDAIAPRCVGEFVAGNLRNSRFVQLAATGHCPNLSAPGETIDVIRSFV